MALSKNEELRREVIQTIIEPFLKDFTYLKSKRTLKRKDDRFTYEIIFMGTKYGELSVTAAVSVNDREKSGDYNCVFFSTVSNITKHHDYLKHYHFQTERRRIIEEIQSDIRQYVLPLFASFHDLETLKQKVMTEGFLPHRKNWDKFSETTKNFKRIFCE